MPINTTGKVMVFRLKRITTEIIAIAIELEARNVLRQLVIWVDLPPRVLVKALDNALEKEAISPIIIYLITLR
jgi:hypothetical protein